VESGKDVFICQERSINVGKPLNNYQKEKVELDQNPYKIVCFGDSTSDDTLIPIAGYEDAFKNLKVYSELLNDELSLLMGKKIQIINSGVSGDTTHDARFRFDRDVMQHHPDLTIIQFGVNDQVIRQDIGLIEPNVSLTRYVYNVLFFIQRLRRQGSKIILMTPGLIRWKDHLLDKFFRAPYDIHDPFGMNRSLIFYVEKIREIAKTEDIPLVDIYEEEKRFDHQEGQSIDDLLPDGIHPNTSGHRLIADKITEKIMENQATFM